MDRLLNFPLAEPSGIGALRKRAEAGLQDDAAHVALGIALAGAGCSHEAVALLRPRRAFWKPLPDAPVAKAALDAQTWWNKNWRTFAQLKQAGRRDDALALLGDRAVSYWDQPALLIHLGGFAAETDRLDLAEHLFRRVRDLAERGLPKMDMTAFAYVSQASLIEVTARRGDVEAALGMHEALTHNPGNAMAHEMQHARLLTRAGLLDDAMGTVAAMLVTAEKARKGYSREMRIDFADEDPDIAPLRQRADWAAMRADPVAYARSR